jgi:MOSC domain-containing protein YiiM
MIEVFSIVYKPNDAPASPPNQYNRAPLESALLTVEHGIDGDKKGGNPARQLNVMSYETLDELGSEGFKVQPGQMGEQIILKGINVNALAVGERLQLGGEACIEVVSYRNGCDRFEAYQGKPRTDAKDRLGIMAKVVTPGTIKVGDPVRILQNV